jgi:hypothetical protein
MSAPVTTKAAENTAKPEDTKTAPQLGALEEDDEFEEFAAEGKGYVSGTEPLGELRALILHVTFLQTGKKRKKTLKTHISGKTIGMTMMLKTISPNNSG